MPTAFDCPPRFVIGDVHGCCAQFTVLVERLSVAHPGCRVVVVGDLVDRGPDSAGVLEYLCGRRHKITSVLGNHDVMFLAAVGCLRPDLLLGIAFSPSVRWALAATRPGFPTIPDDCLEYWLSQGGGATVAAYGCDPQEPASWRFPRHHLAHLANLPLLYEDAGVVVTHALVDGPDVAELRSLGVRGPDAEADARNHPRLSAAVEAALWNRDLPAARPDPRRVHVSGHTPAAGVRHHPVPDCVQVDTGAVFGNHLTAFHPETMAVVDIA